MPTTNTTETDSIISRVRKLLALAEGAGTPEEAGTAYATAQKIIAKHALTEEQVRQARLRETGSKADEPIVSRIVYTTKSHQMQTWISILGGVIADVNGCDMLCWSGAGPAALKAWGRISDLEIVEELLRIIPGQIDALCHVSPFKGRTARNNFRIGAMTTVCARLRAAATAARKAIEAAATEQDRSAPAVVAEITALALNTLDTRLSRAEAAMRKECPRITSRRSSYQRDSQARDAGKAAGHRVALTRSRALS